MSKMSAFCTFTRLATITKNKFSFQTGQKKAFPFSASFALIRLPLLSIAIAIGTEQYYLFRSLGIPIRYEMFVMVVFWLGL